MLNEKDYKHFDVVVKHINEEKMNKYKAKNELLVGLGYFTARYCKEVKKGFVEPRRMVDFLVEVHDEYEAILKKLQEGEGGKE